MPIDTSIYSQIQAPKLNDPLEQYTKIQQLQGVQNQSRLADLMYSEKQREVADDTQVRDLTRQSGGDQTKLRDLLYSGGNYKQGMALDKSISEQRKATVDIDEKQFKLASERHSIYQKSLGALAQEPGLSKDMVLQVGMGLVQQGILPAALFEKSAASLPDDPVQLRARITQGVKSQMTPEQIFTVFAPKPEKLDNGQQIGFRDINPNSPTYGQATGGAAVQKLQSPDSVASVGATLRGQNLVNDRARETLEAGKQQIVQTDNGPVLVNTRTGSGMVVNGPDGSPLPGVTKPLNDSQSKALLFGSRMRDADKALSTLAAEGKVNSVAGSRAPVVGGAINALSTGNNQMLNQAKTDFMTAVLRRESGAAISSGEFDTADRQYFPQIGDSAGVIAQKAANRQLAIKGILMEVPEKHRNSLQATPSANAAKPSNIESLLDKYK